MAARQDQLNNLLNKQLSGMYRRSQISLNSPMPSPAAEQPSQADDAAIDDAAPSAQASRAASPFAETPKSPGPATGLSLKRKNRSSDLTPAASTSASSGPAPNASTSAAPGDVAAPATSSSKRTKASSTANGTTKSSSSSARAREKQKEKEARLPPTARLADLGGISACIEQVLELIAMPICHPEIYLHTGVRPPRGVLLHGPPGCGKTMLANAIAGEVGVAFINVSAPSIVSGMSGESEKTLRETFEEAAKLAPCILFIDEIDAITPKRENAQREMERRIVAQLLTCMDDLSWDKTDNKPVMIIGATNRPDSLDPALRRAGRFDHEIAMGVPDATAREQILRVLSQKLRLAGDFDFRALAKQTPGYVGADLSALTGAAGVIAVKRIFEDLGNSLPPPHAPRTDAKDDGAGLASGGVDEVMNGDVQEAPTAPDGMSVDPPSLEPMSLVEAALPAANGAGPSSSRQQEVALQASNSTLPFDTLPPELQILRIAAFLRAHPSPLTEEQLSPLSITNSDFQLALAQIQPSSKREGFTTVPDVTWSSVGALTAIREELRMAIVQPVKHPEVFEALGIANPCGVLLWGPPGCGKTLLAKAVANESRANFISVKGPELLNKYVGESERAVRQVFERARASSPCIVFFDELDALVPRRDDNLSEASSRVVNTLLTELDGLTPRKQVFVVGATNRPDMIDPAMVRPGRLDKLLYVDLPTQEERREILRTLCRKIPLHRVGGDAESPDLERISRDARCDGFSGADLGALVREAAVTALREALPAPSYNDEGEEVEEPKKEDADRSEVTIKQRHFAAALSKVNPSVSHQQRRKYETLRNRFAGLPVGKKRSIAEEDDRQQESEADDAGRGIGQGTISAMPAASA